jgi:hypothetical protein
MAFDPAADIVFRPRETLPRHPNARGSRPSSAAGPSSSGPTIRWAAASCWARMARRWQVRRAPPRGRCHTRSPTPTTCCKAPMQRASQSPS